MVVDFKRTKGFVYVLKLNLKYPIRVWSFLQSNNVVTLFIVEKVIDIEHKTQEKQKPKLPLKA